MARLLAPLLWGALLRLPSAHANPEALNLDGVEFHVPNGTRAERCASKYTPGAMQALKNVALRNASTRVFFAGMLHNSASVVEAWMTAVDEVTEIIGRDRVHISVIESGSSDTTATTLEDWAKQLGARGVAHTIRTRDDPKTVHIPFRLNDRRTLRIQYLATLRNEVLHPLYKWPGNFSHVIWINDIVWCPGDVLRLMASSEVSGAELTCAMDFLPLLKQTKNWKALHKPQTYLETVFYDSWVTMDIHGTYRLPGDLIKAFLGSRLSQYCPPAPAPCAPLLERPHPAYSCWNGMAAFRATAFAEGVRFRWDSSLDPGSARWEECATSECTLVCKDMWRLGLGRILVDPGVQVAYQDFVHAMRFRKFSSDAAAVPPRVDLNLSQPQSWECLSLSDPGKAQVNPEKRHRAIQKPLANNFGPLPYSPAWKSWPPVQMASALRAIDDDRRSRMAKPIRSVLLTGMDTYIAQGFLEAFSTHSIRLDVKIHCMWGSNQSCPLPQNLIKVCASVRHAKPLEPRFWEGVMRAVSPPPDVVVNAAGVWDPVACEANEELCMQENVPTAMLDAVRAAGSRVIAFSTDMVYGSIDEQEVKGARADSHRATHLEEEGVAPTTAYGRSKVAMEKAIMDRLPESAIILRLSTLLGPRLQVRSLEESKAASGTAVGCMPPVQSFVQEVEGKLAGGQIDVVCCETPTRSFTSVFNVRRVILTLLERAWQPTQAGAYNLGTSGPTTDTPNTVALKVMKRALPPPTYRSVQRAFFVAIGATHTVSKHLQPPNLLMDSRHIELVTGVRLATVNEAIRTVHEVDKPRRIRGYFKLRDMVDALRNKTVAVMPWAG